MFKLMKESIQIMLGGFIALFLMTVFTIVIAMLGYSINTASQIEEIDRLRPKASITIRSQNPEIARQITYWNNQIWEMRSANQTWPQNLVIPDEWNTIDYIQIPAL